MTMNAIVPSTGARRRWSTLGLASALVISSAGVMEAARPARAQEPGPATEIPQVRLRVSQMPNHPRGTRLAGGLLSFRHDTLVVSVLRGPRPILGDTVPIAASAVRSVQVYGPLPARRSCGGTRRLAAQILAGAGLALAAAYVATLPAESFDGAVLSAIGGAAVGGGLGVYMAGIAGGETSSLVSTLGGAAGGSVLFLTGARGDPDRSALLFIGPMLALPVAGAMAGYHVTCRPRTLGWLDVPLDRLELIVGPTPTRQPGIGIQIRSRFD